MFQKQFQSIKKEWLIIDSANQKGFSIAEAIVAVSIFMLIVGSIIGGLVSSNKWSTFFGSKSRATMIAEEGIEAVRNIQDENFFNLVDGSYGLSVSGGRWVFSGTEDIVDEYTRQIVISSIDSDTKQVVSGVIWEYRGEIKSVSVTTYFTNWSEIAVLPSAVSQWRFNENGGETATDSVDGNNGTIYNPIWVAGVSGSALDFNGSNYISVSHSGNLNITQNITIEVWARPDSLGSEWREIVSGRDAANTVNYDLRFSNTGLIQFYWTNPNGGDWQVYSTNNTYAVETWYHIVATRSGTDLPNIYVNGELQEGGCTYGTCDNALLSSGSALYVGAGINTSGNPDWLFDGIIDEVAIYNRVLTIEEIQVNHNAYNPE